MIANTNCSIYYLINISNGWISETFTRIHKSELQHLSGLIKLICISNMTIHVSHSWKMINMWTLQTTLITKMHWCRKISNEIAVRFVINGYICFLFLVCQVCWWWLHTIHFCLPQVPSAAALVSIFLAFRSSLTLPVHVFGCLPLFHLPLMLQT